jgi:hypothetical protein
VARIAQAARGNHGWAEAKLTSDSSRNRVEIITDLQTCEL